MTVRKLLQYLLSRTVHHGKKIVHHTKNLGHHVTRIVRKSHTLMLTHRHHFLTMTHIFLLLGLFMFYHLTGLMFAQEADAPVSVEIATEAVAVPIEAPVEGGVPATDVSVTEMQPLSSTGEVLSEIVTGEVSFVVDEMGNIIVPESTVTGEILTAETLIGEILTGEILTGEILTGEILTGSILGQAGEITTGEIVSVPLSVIYPTEKILLNDSGYVIVTSLESVVTTGGEAGVTYCSRITYENITSILKAGTWTWRETNDYLLQGDADQLIKQGLVDGEITEIPMTGLLEIFTGSLSVSGASVYDVYADFVFDEVKVYHRITVLHGDDGLWYVLDPLRGQKTVQPQIFSEYTKYYDDEIDVHRYVGKGYSPMMLPSVEYQLPSTGDVHTEGNVESIATGDVIPEATGAIDQTTTEPVANNTGNAETPTVVEIAPVEQIVPEPVVSGGGEIAIVDTGVAVDTGIVVDSGIQMLDIFETGYFDHAFALGEISEQVTTLQILLKYLGYFPSFENATFDEVTLDAVYQFQLAKNILKSDDAVNLRGFMGPSTRRALNAELQNYEASLVTSEQLINSSEPINTGDSLATGEVIADVTGTITLETGALDLGINEPLNITGYNRGLIFDPLLNPDLFSGLLADTGLQSYFSGYQYVTGDLIDLVFDTGTQEQITEYLLSRGFVVGSLTLLPMSYAGLVGDSVIDMSLFSGKLLVPIILQSTNEMSGQMAEVELPEGAILKTAEGDLFTGDLMPPVFVDVESLTIDTDENIISAIDVGSDQGITFEDGSGNSVNAVFRVPVPGASVGDILSVNYSEDGQDWTYLDAAEVVDIDGNPYVIFQANHFTTFYLGIQASDFVINNDAVYTTGTLVILHNYTPTATQMRFGNTTGALASGSREPYASTKSWTLTAGTGLKTVYAEFDNGVTMVTVQDTITYLTTLIQGATIFNDTFSPATYYARNRTRQGTDWDAVAAIELLLVSKASAITANVANNPLTTCFVFILVLGGKNKNRLAHVYDYNYFLKSVKF